jgi:putative ABC transport system permease protein
MIKNYFKIAFRNIRRYPLNSIINISGMAISMACAILILLWVQDEWSYDRNFKNADNLYRIIEKQNFSNGEVSMMVPTSKALTKTLKEEYPEIIRSASFGSPPFPLQKGNEFIQAKVAMVSGDFLKMFHIEFVRGDIDNALNAPRNIVITEELAKKYFGADDPIGKTLTAVGGQVLFTITGVIKSLPHNCHLQFDVVFPSEWDGTPMNEWDMRDGIYVELKEGTDPEMVDIKIRDFLKKHKAGSNSEIFLQNIKKIHLYSPKKYMFDVSGNGDITYVRILGLVAVFILLIACVNFMNLSTAQSARRTKEIGVRKVAGASRQKIIMQFLGESLFIVFVAHVIAMIVVELMLPGFNILTGKQLYLNYLNCDLYLGLIAIVLFSGLFAGSYPAFYLSSLKPLKIIKGIVNRNTGNTRFRRTLVIFQFSLSVLLIICTLIIGKQLNYIQNKKLGFNKDHVVYFNFPQRPGDPQIEAVKKELCKIPNVLSVTIARYDVFNNGTLSGLHWTGKADGDDVKFSSISADADFAKTFQLELKEGRFFSTEYSTDASAIMINEQAAKILGFQNPVGEIISTNWGEKWQIIGLVKDFHFKSLHYKIEPLIMQLDGENNFYLRMKPGRIMSTVESIKKVYNSFSPVSPFEFHFLDDDFDNLYRTEQRMGKIVGYFSFLAILISCLGLIGLSSFMIERRTKEIGIRKANGAKSKEILTLLLREYILLVAISILIACPVSWYIMQKWLQNFAYRTTMSWWIFVFAGALAVGIAILTVGFQSYNASRKKPVEALRYE